MGTESRGVVWVPLAYYYLASLLSLAVLFSGLVTGIRGISTVVLPEGSPEVRQSVVGSSGAAGTAGKATKVREPAGQKGETPKSRAVGVAKDRGFREALQGLLVSLAGAALFVWHMRRARLREREFTGNPT